jgi:predicted TIM-barrel fold metal-dependent hydrolase
MVIDIHNHPFFPEYTVQGLIKNMDDNGIDKCVLLTCEEPAIDCGAAVIPFDRCLQYYETVPDRFLLGFCPDPRRHDAIDRLKTVLKHYPLRVCGELKFRMTCDDPDALRLYRFCGEHGLPVLLHIEDEDAGRESAWPEWYGGGIAAMGRALERCPDTIFIGHASGFWSHLEDGGIEKFLEAFPNVFCDISAGSGFTALDRDHDTARSFLMHRQDRVLFGRDWSDSRHSELLNRLGLPQRVLEKIFSGNASYILGGMGIERT